MLVTKMGAYLLTLSAVVLSDAVESVVHVVATLVVYISMRVALMPRDQGHPYGHGRIESFSVGFEGGLVALAGLGDFSHWPGPFALSARAAELAFGHDRHRHCGGGEYGPWVVG